MNGKTYPVDDKMLNYTLVQPVGVCALVSPWNVPFMTATWKVAPCLALGNTAVLKMSELSPLTPIVWANWRWKPGSGWRAQRGAGLWRHRWRRAGTPS